MRKLALPILFLTLIALLTACNRTGLPPEPATPHPTNAPAATPEPPNPTPTLAFSGPTLSVPPAPGPAPVIDGTMDPGEWDGAAAERFSDGSELLLMHRDGYLYLGVLSPEPGVMTGNLFIQRGTTITILHSSAALGTARYQLEGDAWLRSQNFNWRCRDTGFSERAQKERGDFLLSDGWVASNGLMGAENELEYQILLKEPVTALAMNILHEFNSSPFPTSLEDASTQTYPGGMPEELIFSPAEWAWLEFKPE